MDTTKTAATLANPHARIEHETLSTGRVVFKVTEVRTSDNGRERLWELGNLLTLSAAQRCAVRHGLTTIDITRLGVHNFGLRPE